MPAEGTDPVDWSINDVVEFLCHNPHTPWSQSVSGAPRPDPTSFEAALRDNQITGEVLLNDVDKSALRDDLGLRALGHRSSMLMAIRYLQGHSLKYQTSQSQVDSPGEIQTPSHPAFITPKPMHQATSSLYYGPIALSTTSPCTNLPSSISPAVSTSAVNLAGVPNPGESLGPSSTQDTSHTTNLQTPVEDLGPVKRVRSHEQVFVDIHGRKRRRLDLTTLVKSRVDDEHGSNSAHAKEWYMGPGQITLSQLFYSPDPDQDAESFTMVGSNFPTAQRLFVNRCLQYFQKQRPITLDSSQDQTRSAIIPYNMSMVKSGERRFTLYTAKNGKISVSTENIEDWPQLSQPQAASAMSTEILDPSDPLSYLLQRYPVQDVNQEAFPLYGDSGSEGEFDEETWQEIDHEHSEGWPQKPSKLTPTEVESVIRDCISQYESKWHDTCLPKEQRKARRLWLRAKKGRFTNQEIKALLRRITSLNKRLVKLQDAVRESEYATKSELQTQCQSMEQTVMDIQQHKWRVSTLEQEKCPPKISAPLKPISAPRPKHTSGDEESLYSESSDLSDDSIDDFIDKFDIEDQHIYVENNTSTQNPPVSESEDDIISPSGIRRLSKSRKLPFRESSSLSPPPSPTNTSPIECIDLTGNSPAVDNEEYRVETPPLNPVSRPITQPFSESVKSERSCSISPEPYLGPRVTVEIPVYKLNNANLSKPKKRPSLPDIHDINKLVSTPWNLLEEQQDRRRLLAKLIATLSSEERNALRKAVPRYSSSDLQQLIGTGLKLLLKNQKTLPELDTAESRVVMRVASFYISWVNCVHLPSEGIQKHLVLNTQSEISGFGKYYNELCTRLAAYSKKKGSKMHRVNEKEATPDPTDTPHKKRKRLVKESQNAKKSQQSAQLRVALQEKQRKILEQKIGSTNTDPTRQAVSFGNPAIYLDPQIGLRVKPHQLNGIQFMWRELIEDDNKQGCLLAHTMGLGKTMQIISLLATISAAASSNDPMICDQVPEAFHRSQSLILCPSSLIENWYEEVLMWAPRKSGIGPLRKITTSATVSERLQEVCDWDEEGGILIMSYDLFRTWILNRETNKRGKPLNDSDYAKVRECLLEGPNIIVADEAHKMKNPATGISQAAMQFRSKSRIALTGSPLANNLIDYYAMINWIAEGYLGEFVEFKAKFVEPITEGLYVDSTHRERRNSLVKLQVLKEILAPKINRADISVLAGSLPTKVEFVITVPLTNLQKQAYDSYVETILQGKGTFGSAQLWSWLAILSLCCNHPSCFRDKLLSRANDAQKINKKLDEMEIIPGDEPIAQAGLPDSERLVSEQERIFATVSNIKALEMSHRARIMNSIIDESIKAGDKILVFSHSIPTLDYIEYILQSSNRNYSRLDGRTPVVTRQDATKRFNRGSEKQVYLISTRAGGLGLNIPGANRVIIFDFKFSPVWEEQAVGRAYRLGQQKPVFVYRFIAGGTFEEVMYNKAVFKTQLAFRVVDKKNPVCWAQKSLGEYLFPAKPVPQKDIAEYLGKDPQVLDKIIMGDNGEEKSICNIALTETFQKEDNDKLTEEERQGVQQQLSDERLKRTDPEAYNRLVQDRQKQVLAVGRGLKWVASPYTQAASAQPAPRPPQPPYMQPVIPSSAHNTGPPALAPDMSVYQEPSRIPMPSTPAAVISASSGIYPLRYSQSEPPNESTALHTPSRLSSPRSAGQASTQISLQMDGANFANSQQHDTAAYTAHTEPLRSTPSSDGNYENPCRQQ
ncbi:P-loop containing nucleoside triphosphate hydrolase protein [Aspergillus bertholletiae]|uniref:P-loop containing nucleoside triphosphate hydrolase protein n=1 Tax=Aspergillus bertholletiae TaxID=1226010 RepID=A0A5N7BNK7_9EURO|nr:P-loop containing nucleoside triphosphate hydrolase protein [Aspergillus bertholletiae]